MISIEQVWGSTGQAPLSMLAIILCILLANLSILLINLCTFPRLQRTTANAQTPEPSVSVLVPARNEAKNIEDCVRSLLAQRYEALEILILDDQSSDQTAAIVQRLIMGLPQEQRQRLRLLKGKPLPQGWIGKNYACTQLSHQARGAYILFTDADTRHQPEMIQAVIQYMQRQQVQLLTAQPEQLLGSLGERFVVPLLNFTILTLLPIFLIRLRPEPSLATGNGQLLCFERSVYQAIHGHESVKAHILEDVLLARKVKAAGYRMAYIDAFNLVQCRMYHSFPEIWSGFSKNLFAFYNYALPFALGALLTNILLFLLPFLLLLSTPFISISSFWLQLALGAYLLPVLMQMLLALRFNRTGRIWMVVLSFLHPIAITIECLILINAIRWHYRKTGAVWKGRYYAG